MKVYLWFKATSPYAHNVWDVNTEAEVLDNAKADLFHSLTAKLLYITNRKRSDIEPYVALLTARAPKSNGGEWKQLRRYVS